MSRHPVKIAAVLAFCSIGAFGQTPDWKEYDYAKDGFSIASPFKPRLEEQLVDTKGGKLPMHNYDVGISPPWSIMVSVVDLTRFGDMPSKELLQAAKKGSADEVKGSVTSEKEISLDGTVGIEYEIDAADAHSWVRSYYVGGRTISIMSGASHGIPFYPATERFFNSLRFIPTWKEYEYANDGFALSAPSEPLLEKKPVDTAVGHVEAHLYKIRLSGDTGIMVNVSDYGNRTKLSPEVLQKMKDAAATLVKGKIVSEKTISLDNNPGIEFELMGSEGYHSRSRYYIIGNKLIALASFAGEGKPLPPDTTRMLDSLRLLKPM
jgi:hypothetical protein